MDEQLAIIREQLHFNVLCALLVEKIEDDMKTKSQEDIIQSIKSSGFGSDQLQYFYSFCAKNEVYEVCGILKQIIQTN